MPLFFVDKADYDRIDADPTRKPRSGVGVVAYRSLIPGLMCMGSCRVQVEVDGVEWVKTGVEAYFTGGTAGWGGVERGARAFVDGARGRMVSVASTSRETGRAERSVSSLCAGSNWAAR